MWAETQELHILGKLRWTASCTHSEILLLCVMHSDTVARTNTSGWEEHEQGSFNPQIGKGVRQGCILSACLFNLYAEYIMRNAGLEEAQARIKIARRNINHLRYEDDTTLMAESEEELKSLLKEESEKLA